MEIIIFGQQGSPPAQLTLLCGLNGYHWCQKGKMCAGEINLQIILSKVLISSNINFEASLKRNIFECIKFIDVSLSENIIANIELFRC